MIARGYTHVRNRWSWFLSRYLISETSVSLRLAELRSAPLRVAPLSFALLRLASLRSAPLRVAELRSAPLRSAPRRSAPKRLAPLSFALLRLASLRAAPMRLASLRSGFISGCSFRQWFHVTTPCSRISRCCRFATVFSPLPLAYWDISQASLTPTGGCELHATLPTLRVWHAGSFSPDGHERWSKLSSK